MEIPRKRRALDLTTSLHGCVVEINICPTAQKINQVSFFASGRAMIASKQIQIGGLKRTRCWLKTLSDRNQILLGTHQSIPKSASRSQPQMGVDRLFRFRLTAENPPEPVDDVLAGQRVVFCFGWLPPALKELHPVSPLVFRPYRLRDFRSSKNCSHIAPIRSFL